MNYTDQLKLPYLAAGQAQKHVTLNESLRMLDALVQLSLKSRTLAAPPAAPNAGARYLIPAGASGAWAGKSGFIAAWQDGAWAYFSPQTGWRAFIEAEGASRVYNGTAWVAESASSTSTVDLIGINASASTTNRLTVKSAASLFDAEGGNHRIVINKTVATNTASTLFQTNYSGRAEFGLTGSDDFQLKTSPDGAAWANVLTFDKTTGLGVVKADPTALLGIATKQYVDTRIATAGVGSGALPAGAIAHFAMSTPPSGWLKANGAAVSRATYAALFAAIGSVYGAGDGATTFNLPDLRGEFIRSWDDARGVDQSRLFGSAQPFATKVGLTSDTGLVPNNVQIIGSGNTYRLQTSGTLGTSNQSPQETETRPRNIALLACIKA